MGNLVPPGKSLCEEGWKWSPISKFSCSAASSLSQTPSVGQLLWDSCRAAGMQPTTSYHSLKAPVPCSLPTVGCRWMSFCFSRIAVFPCKTVQVQCLQGTQGFPGRCGVRGKTEISVALHREREQSPSPGTGCRAASETDTVLACVPKLCSHCQQHSEGTHRTGPHCNQAQPAPPALPGKHSTHGPVAATNTQPLSSEMYLLSGGRRHRGQVLLPH